MPWLKFCLLHRSVPTDRRGLDKIPLYINKLYFWKLFAFELLLTRQNAMQQALQSVQSGGVDVYEKKMGVAEEELTHWNLIYPQLILPFCSWCFPEKTSCKIRNHEGNRRDEWKSIHAHVYRYRIFFIVFKSVLRYIILKHKVILSISDYPNILSVNVNQLYPNTFMVSTDHRFSYPQKIHYFLLSRFLSLSLKKMSLSLFLSPSFPLPTHVQTLIFIQLCIYFNFGANSRPYFVI